MQMMQHEGYVFYPETGNSVITIPDTDYNSLGIHGIRNEKRFGLLSTNPNALTCLRTYMRQMALVLLLNLNREADSALFLHYRP